MPSVPVVLLRGRVAVSAGDGGGHGVVHFGPERDSFQLAGQVPTVPAKLALLPFQLGDLVELLLDVFRCERTGQSFM